MTCWIFVPAVALANPTVCLCFFQGSFGFESPSSFQDMPLIARLDCSIRYLPNLPLLLLLLLLSGFVWL
jgi:hypothetical protein